MKRRRILKKTSVKFFVKEFSSDRNRFSGAQEKKFVEIVHTQAEKFTSLEVV